MYTFYFYGSPDYKNRVTRKFTLQKNGFNIKNIHGMLNIFYILIKEKLFIISCFTFT